MPSASSLVLVNGQRSDSVPVWDRGLQYGDGLFETLRIVNGEPVFWLDHMQRLEAGCQRLGIDYPGEALLRRELGELVGADGRGVLKIIITRGVSARGYRPGHGAAGRILLWQPRDVDLASDARPGWRVTWCRHRLGINPALAGIKHLNRLDQVLARAEWDDEFDEGLMLDLDGRLVEGTMSNIFLVMGRTLVTPGLNRCGVAGIMRKKILERAGTLKFETEIRDVAPADVAKSDELLLCNSVIGIRAVARLGEQRWSAFPVSEALREALELS